jgi:hypothetical protein
MLIGANSALLTAETASVRTIRFFSDIIGFPGGQRHSDSKHTGKFIALRLCAP